MEEATLTLVSETDEGAVKRNFLPKQGLEPVRYTLSYHFTKL